MVTEKDLVLDEPAALVAVVAHRRERDVERVLAEIAAEREHVARPDGAHVGGFHVERLGIEDERERQARRSARQEVRRVAGEQVGEERDSTAALLVAGREVGHAGVARDVEGADAAVDDAFGSSHAAAEGDDAAAGDVVVDAGVELRLRRPLVRERRIGCLKVIRNGPRGTRQRILRQVARRQLERPAIVHGFCMRPVDVEERAAVLVAARDVAVERPCADRQRGPALRRQLARRLGDHVDDPGHRIGAPDRGGRPADDFNLADVVGIGGHEVPHDHAEEIEVHAAAVDQRELRRRQRGGRPAGGQVDVAGRHLGHVDARHGAEEVADVGGRRVLNGLRGDEAHGGRRVDELLLRPGCGDDDLFLVGDRLVGVLRFGGRRLLRGGLGREGKARDHESE